jgi:putative ABC transport system substrate-binding protein
MRTGTLGRVAATFLGVLLAFAASELKAQPAVKARLAILSPFSSPEPAIDAFRQELARLGWVDGRNLEIETRLVHGRLEHLPAMAAELVGLKPNVIFAPGEQGLAAAKKATRETAIVTIACDPLDRLIVSLAAPGGSATGLSCVHSELAGKRLELLKELVPKLERAAVLYNGSDPSKRLEFGQLQAAGQRIRVAVRPFEVTDADGIEEAFAVAAAERAGAVVVLVDAFTIFHRQRIADLALARRLPSVFGFKEFVEAGGLLS